MTKRWVWGVLLAGAVSAGWGQGTAAPKKAAPAKPGVADPAPVARADTGAKGEKRMTPEQQKVLLTDVDATLKFASTDTKLEVKHPVKAVFISRDQVATELRKRFDEDEGAKRMERSELVLKKFGLLDRDFHLRPFLLSLLTEQIAGFYDNKTHVMNLLDWVPEEQQLPVMAHELTHALQDQRVNLEVWGEQEVKGVAQNVVEDNHHIQKDEVDTAREAVLEGQAMVAFADYELKGSGKTLKDVPQLVNRLQQGSTDMTGSPVMARAPLVLQQALLFPYVEGLGFEAALLTEKGTDRAFAGVLDAPPATSMEVLHPEAYVAHVTAPLLRMPDVHPLLDAEWAPYDVGVMGELDVRMTTELFGGRPMAEALAPAWAGGIYYAVQRKNTPEAQRQSTGSLALLWESRWKNPESAETFFGVYEGQLARKYEGLKRRTADETDESERVYSTNEGDVLVTRTGSSVFISEGFDVVLARKLHDAVEAVQGVGKMQQAEAQGLDGRVPTSELIGGLAKWMGSFGVIRATLPAR